MVGGRWCEVQRLGLDEGEPMMEDHGLSFWTMGTLVTGLPAPGLEYEVEMKPWRMVVKSFQEVTWCELML